MATAATVVGLIFLLAVIIFVPLFGPTALVVAVATFATIKLASRPIPRLFLFIGVCGLMSLNVRILTWMQGDPNEVRTNIAGVAAIGPDERIVLDSDSQYIYFRRRSDPPRFGLRNDWGIGFIPLETVYEEPSRILSNLGIGHRSGTDGKTVLRIRTTETGGVLRVSASVLIDGRFASEYTHTVRKSYPLEQFDYLGNFKDGDWVTGLLYLTQSTLWASRRELVPATYRPLHEFLKAAIEQRGISEDGRSIKPVIDGLDMPRRLRKVDVTPDLTRLQPDAFPAQVSHVCLGKDSDQEFRVVAPETVIWKDSDLPPMTIPRSWIDGYLVLPWGIACDKEPNRFWLGAYHVGKVNLWQYRVDYLGRSLRLERWLQAEVSSEARREFDGLRPRVFRIGEVRNSFVEVFILKADTDNFGRSVVDHGYKIQIATN